jgi:hypothetical protein
VTCATVPVCCQIDHDVVVLATPHTLASGLAPRDVRGGHPKDRLGPGVLIWIGGRAPRRRVTMRQLREVDHGEVMTVCNEAGNGVDAPLDPDECIIVADPDD